LGNTQMTGSLGIGMTATHRLDVSGAPVTDGAAQDLVALYDSRNTASGVGGGITFGGRYNNTSAYQTFSTIQGVKENATSGDYASALVFFTRQNASAMTERLRITSTGNIRIDTPTPATPRPVPGAVQ